MPLEVGPYSGFVSANAPSSVDLFAFRGHHYLVLAADGLIAAQLVAIAKSGLPSSLGSEQSGSANCG